MARPRTVSDEKILQATIRMMAKHGPVAMTLAHVAGEIGLSPAALVKRFGSKRALLLEVSKTAGAGMAAALAELRRTAASPLAALLDAATFLARHTRSAEELANHLAFLQIDVTDPEFRRPMLALSRATLAGYRGLLDDAIARKELRRCDTEQLARVLNAVVGGSLIAWAVFRKGSAEAWLRADLEAALEPHRLPRKSGT
ncbi:MAG TPA: helix-turn-helix domain-containing protein [Kofleriaceae bacterium]|nr:helix-turn-helix domain-containing protein [Kofleriaceae bacterium]